MTPTLKQHPYLSEKPRDTISGSQVHMVQQSTGSSVDRLLMVHNTARKLELRTIEVEIYNAVSATRSEFRILRAGLGYQDELTIFMREAKTELRKLHNNKTVIITPTKTQNMMVRIRDLIGKLDSTGDATGNIERLKRQVYKILETGFEKMQFDRTKDTLKDE